MTNLIARFAGSSDRIVVFCGHYDTKRILGRRFLGANDGGSSTGLLLELARVVAARKRTLEVRIVWFDGEEAYESWSPTDGLYGSRHLAELWRRDGTLGRIIALINADMIGDRDLDILKEYYSSRSLQNLIWSSAASLGLGRHFLPYGGAVEDDHVPFLRQGVTAVNLIDFNYGPNNSWWHTEQDTLDKLSPRSFEIVGKVLLDVLRRLERLGRTSGQLSGPPANPLIVGCPSGAERRLCNAGSGAGGGSLRGPAPQELPMLEGRGY